MHVTCQCSPSLGNLVRNVFIICARSRAESPKLIENKEVCVSNSFDRVLDADLGRFRIELSKRTNGYLSVH